ncbi:S1C family serine protease [Paenibacillus popilliae]|uniref:Trypsin-like serine protease n=1 Tax=Paenibacillus popilliae ATCC 14706 TaxID=1212764 RepID=M9L7L2_PAEPP|nr:trypsin-like peptidase domain-containing protein [Paenibacillus popilliae]GAC40962.1 trypsin-like serine protease [Paenibacillus popilliae ATCC 14706]
MKKGEKRIKAVHARVKGLCGGMLALVLLWGAMPLAAHGADAVMMKAASIDGKVYVQAEAMQQWFGGEGTYNSKTQTYSYTPNDVPAVIQKVGPSVVTIVREKEGVGYDGHGSGFVVREDGWIVTNAHVVEGASKLQVVALDGTAYSVKKWYADAAIDLALLQIKASGLKPVAFAKQTPQVGEPVLALGTPQSMMLRNSATVGIVSGIERSYVAPGKWGYNYKMIQADVAINGGNSGGPLYNMKGEVIGVNSSKFTGNDIDNMGFVIPADTVQMAIRHFMNYGKIKRADLGIELEEDYAASEGLPGAEPLRVTAVQSEVAKQAGICEGDVLYAVGGRQVKTLADVIEALKLRLPGQRVSLTMQSDGDVVERTVALVEG